MSGAVWVYGEVRDGEVTSATRELVSKAAELGEATVVLLGPGADVVASDLGRNGATRALVDTNPAYHEHLALPAADALTSQIQQRQPALVMFAMTYDSRDVASRLAARLSLGVVSNVTDIQLEGSSFRFITPWATNTIGVCELRSLPQIVLVRPKSFAARETGGTCQVEQFQAQLSDGDRAVRVMDAVEQATQGPSLADASVVIAGGRGLGNPDNFSLVEQLASVLGAAVGATRAVVDAGWRPYGEQIGQTGVTVKPNVYIACGISGAVQHLAGMKNSKNIIAINRDPDAPIFRSADLGVVGDATKILPQLIEEVKRRKGS